MMRMNKRDFYTKYLRMDRFDDRVWDNWFLWRLEQAGGRDHSSEVIEAMPHYYTWQPNLDETITFYWNENGEDKEQTIPMDICVNDLDEQPDLEMLWHCGFYDHPLNGVAKYNGEYVWFDIIYDEDDYADDYDIYKLSEEDIAYEKAIHEKFQRNVGYHCDHEPKVHKEFEGKSKTLFDEFYNWVEKLKKDKPRKDYTKNEKLGTFGYYQFRNYVRPRNC